jgi:mannose-6-phosphate isomerase-like protein (cupin superfamily)
LEHTTGEHVWHVHEHTDEFFLVIDGQFDIALREPDGQERTAELSAGDIFVVPKGHRAQAIIAGRRRLAVRAIRDAEYRQPARG